MTTRVVVLGAGGFATEVADVFRDLALTGHFYLLGFVDRDRARQGEWVNDTRILGTLEDLPDDDAKVIAGAGEIVPRKRQVEEAEASGRGFVSVVHPTVVKSPFVTIGTGCVICAGSILTNDIILGNHVALNLGVTVGHNCRIGDHCVLSPGVHVSGWVSLEREVYVGTGAVILPRVSVGAGAVIGAGAVVTKDVAAGETVVGMPARRVHHEDVP